MNRRHFLRSLAAAPATYMLAKYGMPLADASGAQVLPVARLQPGRWYRISAYFPGANEAPRVYVDGLRVALSEEILHALPRVSRDDHECVTAVLGAAREPLMLAPGEFPTTLECRYMPPSARAVEMWSDLSIRYAKWRESNQREHMVRALDEVNRDTVLIVARSQSAGGGYFSP